MALSSDHNGRDLGLYLAGIDRLDRMELLKMDSDRGSSCLPIGFDQTELKI